MSDASLAALFGWTGAAAGLVTVGLQALRIRSNGREGVSALTWTLFLGTNGFWIAYGAAHDAWPITIGASGSTVVLLMILVQLGPRRIWRELLIGTGGAFAASMAAVALGGWDVGIICAELIGVSQAIPQIRELYRTDTARGVSVGSWLTGAGLCTAWAGYSLFEQLWVLLAMNVVLIAMNLVVAVLTMQRHRKLRRLELVASAR